MPNPKNVFCMFAIGVLACGLRDARAPKERTKRRMTHPIERKVERVLLLPPGEEMQAYLGGGFYESFARGFLESLAQKNVACEALQPKDGKLGPADVRAACQRFRGTQVLEVSAARNGKAASGYPMFEIRFVLEDIATGTVVWRTKGLFYGGPQPEQIGREIVQRLSSSHLL
jgi:hypothetical protein